jgi:hypothetical protein
MKRNLNIITSLFITAVLTSTIISCEKGKKDSTGDMYVAGYEEKAAVLWKNGSATTLASNYYSAAAKSVFVAGKNVYVAGHVNNVNGSVATVWKDGEKQEFIDGTNVGSALSIFVK